MKGMLLIIGMVAAFSIGCGSVQSGKAKSADPAAQTWRETGPDGRDRIHVRQVDEVLGEVVYIFVYNPENDELELVEKSEPNRGL